MNPNFLYTCYNIIEVLQTLQTEGENAVKDRLAHGLRKHDEKALEKTIEQYSRLVASVVYSVSKGSLTKEDIEEVVSDIFVTLWNNAEKVQDGRLKGYICTIARTRTLNKLAATNSSPILNIDDYDPEDDFSIADETEKKDIHRELREIIKEITMPDREILIRYYYYFQTVSQIAAEMDIKTDTVKTKLRRTREKIKAKLIERSYTI